MEVSDHLHASADLTLKEKHPSVRELVMNFATFLAMIVAIT
jgi:hypothetical protein